MCGLGSIADQKAFGYNGLTKNKFSIKSFFKDILLGNRAADEFSSAAVRMIFTTDTVFFLLHAFGYFCDTHTLKFGQLLCEISLIQFSKLNVITTKAEEDWK